MSKNSHQEHWRQAGRQEYLPGEEPGNYYVRTFSDKVSFERMFLFDSIGWSSLSHRLVDNYILKFNRKDLLRPRDTFRLALLEAGLDHTNPNGEILQDERIGAVRVNPEKENDWKSSFLKKLEIALECNADVICSGEFSFPSTINSSENYSSLVDQIVSILSKVKRPVFFLAGSQHTPLSTEVDGQSIQFNQNIAPIFGGDSTACNEIDVEFKNPQPLSHFKRSPSTQIGERIYSPANTDLPVYCTPFANIGVLICSDAFDSRVLFSYLSENMTRAKKAQIILIPSYNESPLFLESCRYLSYLANSMVVYLNSRCHQFPDECIKMYVGGFEASEIPKFVRTHGELFIEEDQESIKQCIKRNDQYGSLSDGVALYDVDSVSVQNFSRQTLELAGQLVETAQKKILKFQK